MMIPNKPTYWDNHFFYSPKYRWGFYNINKNASRSIYSAFGFTGKHVGAVVPTRIFCVIRDIVDRFISIYRHSIKLYRAKQFDFLIDVVPPKIDEVLASPDAFLNYLIDKGFWDNHQAPQMWFLDGRLIGGFRRLEHIEAFLNFHDLDNEIKRIAPGMVLPKINVQKNKGDLSKFINRRKNDILKLYAEDIALIDKAGMDI